MELQTQKQIVEKYGLKDGQMITGIMLKQMAKESQLKIDEVIILLGISETAKYRVRKNEKTKTRVNLKIETEREEKSNIVPPKLFFIFNYVYIIHRDFRFVKKVSDFHDVFSF